MNAQFINMLDYVGIAFSVILLGRFAVSVLNGFTTYRTLIAKRTIKAQAVSLGVLSFWLSSPVDMLYAKLMGIKGGFRSHLYAQAAAVVALTVGFLMQMPFGIAVVGAFLANTLVGATVEVLVRLKVASNEGYRSSYDAAVAQVKKDNAKR